MVLHRINSARLECHFPRFPSWDGSGLGLATRSGRREGSGQQYVSKAGAGAGGCGSSRPPLLAGRPSAGATAPARPLPRHLGPARSEEFCQGSTFPPTASPAVPRLRQVLLSGTLPSSARTTADTGFDRAAVRLLSNPSSSGGRRGPHHPRLTHRCLMREPGHAVPTDSLPQACVLLHLVQ